MTQPRLNIERPWNSHFVKTKQSLLHTFHFNRDVTQLHIRTFEWLHIYSTNRGGGKKELLQSSKDNLGQVTKQAR